MTASHTRRARPVALACLTIALALLVCAAPAAAAPAPDAPSRAGAAAAPERLSPIVRRRLAAVRSATARYRDPSRAVLDGYRLFPGRGCVGTRAGLMGFHFVNVANLLDGRHDLKRPDYLLYAPTPGGGFELAGVEWEESYTGQPAPRLFGRDFDGPMAGHVPGQPVHYDIHVWVHRGNPSGTFARYNPAMSCCPPEHHGRPPRRAARSCGDPDAPFLGAGALSPATLRTPTRATARWELSWTHPDDWRRLRRVTVRLRDGGREVGRVIFDEATGAVRATGPGIRLRRHGTGLAADEVSGRRVTVRLALRLSRRLAGRRLTAVLVARQDDGGLQRMRRAGVVEVRR